MGAFQINSAGSKPRKCRQLLAAMAFAGLLAAPPGVWAQALAPDLPSTPTVELPSIPNLNEYANPKAPANSPIANEPELVLSAKLSEEGDPIGRGLVWRVFSPEASDDGKLALLATSKGGTTSFNLAPGSYLVHVAFGRAGATKRITMTRAKRSETMILDAGGVKLNAVLSGGGRIPPDQLRFSIYEDHEDSNGERALIIPDVKPDSVVRLNTGTYQIVSNYGTANAVIRSDIRVEAGKITEANVEHRAAQLTLKLVRETGGEAMADTAWSVLTTSGDIVRESVGAFASIVLAEGEYVIIAKNKDRIYQRDFKVVAGQNQDVEVLAKDGASTAATANQPADGEEPLD
ncbi:hypothetical protein B5P45_06720 [Phyllobacterium zundukense]|uniref:Carboxypeptidase regulatory-like domain-containing protein n=2 Tax=Phyllobacterium zundukense TaxID=1867719 RepID=A0A2N9W1R5_9HYPH|nr:hypothetical protein [Phyllobacterium zundukense]ATU91544.1 hypothetical protein BLM14_07810 [Phyllobacterium zundukense]PIO45683.1 hypothetical protein B5P45_06720 [Phyllobacterium zundukense]